jgi:hypothetical protein
MNEQRLRQLLREAPVPEAEGAERRGLMMVAEAFRQRVEAPPPRSTRTSPRRLAISLAIAAVLAALLLSPAGASVRHWVGDVFADNVPPAQPGLANTPGAGRLLVVSGAGPWVVQPDGSRRLLGDYGEATWSPHGLFVAAVSGRTLTAVEPDGSPHWSLTAGAPISDPRWSPTGFRIAYRAGRELRVTAANGSGDHGIEAGTAAVAPAWMPQGLPELAYVDGSGRLRIADSESGRVLNTASALAGVVKLAWGEGGTLLLEASRGAVRLRTLRIEKLTQGIEVGPGRRLPLPAGATVRDAAISPAGGTVAVLVRDRRGGGSRSSVLLFARNGAPRRLLAVPGSLSELAFSPDGGRLLIAWPEADEWLFLPLGRGRGKVVGDVSAAFAPGQRAAAFPQIEGWCCHAR